MSISVYSKPSCVQCVATKRALQKQGLDFIETDVTKDDAALELVRSLGHMQAPVVVVERADGVTHWSGFRPDRIKELAASLV